MCVHFSAFFARMPAASARRPVAPHFAVRGKYPSLSARLARTRARRQRSALASFGSGGRDRQSSESDSADRGEMLEIGRLSVRRTS